MAKFESSITINRPAEEVFAFAVDTANAAKWQEGVVEAATTSSGAVGVGTTYRYVVKAMGQKLDTTGEITAWAPPKTYTWKATSGPFPMSGGIACESVEGGTRITQMINAEPGGFFKLAEPLMMSQQQSQMDAGLKKLKEILEKK